MVCFQVYVEVYVPGLHLRLSLRSCLCLCLCLDLCLCLCLRLCLCPCLRQLCLSLSMSMPPPMSFSMHMSMSTHMHTGVCETKNSPAKLDFVASAPLPLFRGWWHSFARGKSCEIKSAVCAGWAGTEQHRYKGTGHSTKSGNVNLAGRCFPQIPVCRCLYLCLALGLGLDLGICLCLGFCHCLCLCLYLCLFIR